MFIRARDRARSGRDLAPGARPSGCPAGGTRRIASARGAPVASEHDREEAGLAEAHQAQLGEHGQQQLLGFIDYGSRERGIDMDLPAAPKKRSSSAAGRQASSTGGMKAAAATRQNGLALPGHSRHRAMVRRLTPNELAELPCMPHRRDQHHHGADANLAAEEPERRRRRPLADRDQRRSRS
jgi:hypothetical protein